ncbi:MAG: uncharacterized protein K0S35_2985 [Geminicoccaceae bacterium]|nr:uncharacterized protein [Geminicoccaceae bacterium]
MILGAPPVGPEWRELLRGETWTHYHAANLPLELHHVETEAYLLNLAQEPPRIYVVLRPATEPAAQAYRPLLITASPVEAESYLASGDEIVEGVPMPAAVIAWLRDFVDRTLVTAQGRGAQPPAGAGGCPGPDRRARGCARSGRSAGFRHRERSTRPG